MKLSAYFAQERGAQARLAKTLNIPAPMLSAWASEDPEQRRPVPIERCLAIENATNQDVTRKDLRPDDWHKVWPDFKEPATVGGDSGFNAPT